MQKHIYFPFKRYKYSIYSMVSTILTSLNEITGSIIKFANAYNYARHNKIYLFMSLGTSRGVVGLILPC